jgi:nuclear transport factor 2 (NTF2) superfamily protein
VGEKRLSQVVLADSRHDAGHADMSSMTRGFYFTFEKMIDSKFRSYGNENWEFDEHGLMQRRYASINDLPIKESDRKYRWPLGRRPEEHSGLSDLGL